MNIKPLHSICRWAAIIATAVSLISAIGNYWISTIIALAVSLISAIGIYGTGKIIERENQEIISRLETRLKAVQPRSISESQRETLIETLGTIKGHRVAFITRLMDSEGADFARELGIAFNQAGWEVGQTNKTWLDDSIDFVTAAVPDDGINYDETLNVIKGAFLKAGIDFRLTSIRKNSISLQTQPNTVYIFVGRRA